MSVALIWGQYMKRARLPRCKAISPVVLYFLLAVIVTFAVRGRVTSGLQQLFAYPSLCFFIIGHMKKNPEKLLNSIINILIINFTINMAAFKRCFDSLTHITYLGHVQMVSQMGLIAIFVSCLYWMMFRRRKYKIIYLTVITVVTMLVTDADSAVFTALIMLAAAIVYKWKLYHILDLKPYWYIGGMYALSVFVVYITAVDNVLEAICAVPDFSGRKFVWQAALLKITEKPIAGYGIDGVLLRVFWTEWFGGIGFNYAHNQIMQNLMDGGIILFAAFAVMMYGVAAKIREIPGIRYRMLANASLVALLFIMIFDSTTIYCYMYVILSIDLTLPYILEKNIYSVRIL